MSAPLWNSKTSTFAGLLTSSDFINVIQYYYQYPSKFEEIDRFRLDSLRGGLPLLSFYLLKLGLTICADIEKAIGVTPIETVSVHPMVPLYDACRRMLKSRARRIPLIDIDDETQQEMVVSVLTQFRILKFVAVNVRETQMLRKPLCDLGIGTYKDVQTAGMDTPVIKVIHQLVKKDISSVPIVDDRGMHNSAFQIASATVVGVGNSY